MVQSFAMQELITQLLAKRGVTTKEEREQFLKPDYERDIHDPFLLVDMDVAVARISQAIDENEHIAIYSDFDADGIPAGALLHDVCKKVGHERFTNYIPHRDTEGYGFHIGAVDALHAQEVTLIITVDVGITGHEATAHAKDLGIDVIITDHHLPGETLPDALAVINPQRLDDFYPNIHLCGSGVAFKLTQALIATARSQEKEWIADVPEGWEKWLLDLVAIATVGDMMQLVGENRALVHFGLVVLRKGRRPGVGALCRKLGFRHQYLTEDDIGFSIAPRINASSRMGSPETAFQLLTTDDESIATTAAKELESLNNKRKGTVASMVRVLNERFKNSHDMEVLVAGNPEWNPALLGLAANSLVDTYGKTACLWGRDGTGALKGSCRSNGDVHIVEFFKALGDTLTHFGGHEFAGGFSIAPDAVHTFADVCNEAATHVKPGAQTQAPLASDASLPPLALSQTHAQLECLSPFGMGNPKPVLLYEQVEIASVRQFGKEELHLEVQLNDEARGGTLRAIAFFKTHTSFTRDLVAGERVDVLATLELSRFAGRTSYELRILDVR